MKKKVKFLIKNSFIGALYLKIIRFIATESKIEGVESKKMFSNVLTYFNYAVFFGYHDKTPFSEDNKRILAMAANVNAKDADGECSPLKIGYYSISEKSRLTEFNYIGDSTTWCWQQGCMLQWNPKAPNTQIIYNRLVDNRYGSVIQDVEKKEIIREFDTPIYSVSACGNFAASLNFSRLGRLRPGYGYIAMGDDSKDDLAPQNDGLFILDLNSGVKALKISLYQLAKEINVLEFENYINHISFSPDGKFLVFFHIWLDHNKKRNIRFMKYDIEQQDYSLVEENKTISHYCWLRNGTLMVTAKSKNQITWEYLIFNINESNSFVSLKLPLKTDGHPMQCPVNEDVFVADTRMNNLREDKVVIFSLKSGKTIEVSKFLFPYGYEGQVRCDLHPRWDKKGEYVSVDIVNKGQRAMAIIDVRECLNVLK